MSSSILKGQPRNGSKAGLVIQPDSPWLAPLAGYSNLPFRVLCRELGAGVACTEMVSAKGIYYSLEQFAPPLLEEISGKGGKGSRGTWALLASQDSDWPLVVQLFGAEAEIVKAAATAVLELFKGREIYFDLNMGCSVPKVVKTGAGAVMLEDVPNALKVARALIEAAGPGRAGFKLRLGWLKGDDVYLDVARRLEDLGAGWVTLHPRYGKQAFTGQADWAKLGRLKGSVGIPVVASGDLLTAQAAKNCLEQTGADAVMFARGAMNNPFIFREFCQLMHEGQISQPTAAELLAVISRHRELSLKWQDERYALSQMRGFIPRYVHNFPGVRALRQSLSACQNWDDMDIVISEFMLALSKPGALNGCEKG